MHSDIEYKLRQLLIEYGSTIVVDERRCAALMLDYCGPPSRSLNVLIVTLNTGMVKDIARCSAEDRAHEVERWVIRLEEDYAFTSEVARWATETWRRAIDSGCVDNTPATTPGLQRNPGPIRRPFSPESGGTGLASGGSTTPPLIVSKLGPEYFHTIADAIQSARPGSRIIVRPGIYSEGIVLDKSVEIIGEGNLSDIIVQTTNGDSCINMQAEYAVVRNLTLRGRAGLVNKTTSTVYVPKGRLVIEHCDITSDSGSCVLITGALANPVVRFCEIHESKDGHGIYFDAQSEGIIEDCNIYGNEFAQVVIEEQSTCVLKRCHIHDGKDCGVWIDTEGRGRCEDCLICGNTSQGVIVEAGSNPFLYRCDIHSNGDTGLWVRNKGKGEITECTIHANGENVAQVAITDSAPEIRRCKVCDAGGRGILFRGATGVVEDCEIDGAKGAGIALEAESDPTVRRCVVRDGITNGVLITDKSKGTFEDCEVARHPERYPAVVIRGASMPLLLRCRIHTCGSNGVWVKEKSTGTLLDCQIYDTNTDGVDVAEESAPVLKKCTIRNSQVSGVWVRDKSTATLEACRISDNQRAGVTVQDGGNPELRDCTICDNRYEAVWIKENSTATVTGCNLSGNKRGPWDIAAGCLVRRRRNHVEGQTFLNIVCWDCGETFEAERAGPVICPSPECRAAFVVDEQGVKVRKAEQNQEQESGDNGNDSAAMESNTLADVVQHGDTEEWYVDEAELEEAEDEEAEDEEAEDEEDEEEEDEEDEEYDFDEGDGGASEPAELDDPVTLVCDECGEEWDCSETGITNCPGDDCYARYEIDDTGDVTRVGDESPDETEEEWEDNNEDEDEEDEDN